ncbi:M56 family metallopeptidase [Mycolicibacterium confluentis]|uniref:Uncharacterized protein n=1 Tax=Mycolicibacterium confluentis TaxID=28047 RepID=A0A7I7XVV0_9MYCO|nr:M56 family metallopeptidase [Mycolicibacterium confluentis]MCV7321591.1 M56 family metallopeptidase [Mycolicibacterium confluentis]ORV26703.1 hypothetical protein AWB99_20960 [Mycolicibacterium confluentis]BBZ33399.1 hypothetical protein MCNF_20040 [Mycolicibacterium confluentis]
MLSAALAVAWVLAALVAPVLSRVHSLFSPGWSVRVLGLGALALAVATLSSVVAAVCAMGVSVGLPVGWLWAVMSFVVALGVSRVVVHVSRMRALSRSADVFRRGVSDDHGVLLVDDPVPAAFAVPGGRGAVVATTGLRDALSAAEFDAVLRHERAHLRHHHQVYVQMAELAACVNPILRQWCREVRFAAERHADECAARAGRAVTAQALAKVALLTSATARAAPDRLGISDGAHAIVQRVCALRRPAPRRQRIMPLVAAVLLLVAVGADSTVTIDWMQDRLVAERAESVADLLR